MVLLRTIHGWSGFSDLSTVMVVIVLVFAIACVSAWVVSEGYPPAGIVSWIIGPIGIYLLWRAFQAVNPGSHMAQWMLLLFVAVCLTFLVVLGVADGHLASYLMTVVFGLATILALINVIVGYTNTPMPAFLS